MIRSGTRTEMSRTTDSTTSDPEQRLRETLRARGQRVTSQRIVIHRALHELDRHVTAEEVLRTVSRTLPNLSLPTVYATLDLLEELGMVRRISPGEGPVLYDPRGEEHHHLVCRRCGRVEDVDAGVDMSRALRAARRKGFVPRGAAVVVSGLCQRCSEL
jgi:Fe2+ or Zn2+ uptake regulation protein